MSGSRVRIGFGFLALGLAVLAAIAIGSYLLLNERGAGPDLARLPLYLALALIPAVGLAALLLARLIPGDADGESHRELERELEERAAAADRQQSQLEDLLDLMTAGVLVLDEGGRVTTVNRGAAEVLGVDDVTTLMDRPLVHSVRSLPLVSLAEQALAEGRAVREPVELTSGRIILAEAIPLRHLPPEKAQVLFFLRDETAQFRTDQMRRDFVANVSHELKTPLAGLSLLASTLQHAVDEDPEQAKAFAGRMSPEIERLSDLVDDLLTLSRLEDDGAGVPDAEPFDLAAAAASVARELQPRADREGRRLRVEIDHPVPVEGDRALLEMAVRNLLENALRYTEPGGTIELSVDQTEDEAVLAVKDDGMGIPRDQQDRIFERFYRVDRARSRETGGTGLGLSIVRHIVELHQGRIEVESALGLGTTFTVHLPAARLGEEPTGADWSPAAGPDDKTEA